MENPTLLGFSQPVDLLKIKTQTSTLLLTSPSFCWEERAGGSQIRTFLFPWGGPTRWRRCFAAQRATSFGMLNTKSGEHPRLLAEQWTYVAFSSPPRGCSFCQADASILGAALSRHRRTGGSAACSAPGRDAFLHTSVRGDGPCCEDRISGSWRSPFI